DLMRARLRTALSDAPWRGALLVGALLAAGLFIIAGGNGLLARVSHERATVAEVVEQTTAYGPRVTYAVAFPDGHRMIATSGERAPQEAPGDTVCLTLTQRFPGGSQTAALAPADTCPAGG
nr:DUF1996 domain-containing protein [Paracoccaceae bacterium]